MKREELSASRELSENIVHNRELGITHLAYDRELAFYDAVKGGDEDTVRAIMLPLKNENLGLLSENPVRNMKYHLTVTIALITRFCIEAGMPAERAYTLSDIYIRQMDVLESEDKITELHEQLVFDYTRRMQKLSTNSVYSKPIILAMNYIERNLHTKISLDGLAEYLGLNKTYLCRLFKSEMGCTVGSFIKKQKIRSAENMLIHSEISPSAIGEYLSFSSQSHFIKVFREETGYTPLEYRNKFFGRHFDG